LYTHYISAPVSGVIGKAVKRASKLAVIIPFFQREPGILARALESIRSQHIPDGWRVDVIVVDDASPCSADDETRQITFTGPVRLKVVRQDNGGVAAARNRGLDEARTDTSLIAFLDSDDIWPANHLARAIRALATGTDFYFTDNRRAGYHESCIRERAIETGKYIATARTKDGFLAIPPDRLLGLIIKEFPAQASTVVYKRSIAPALRFNTTLNAAGEDILFLCTLVAAASSAVFDPESCVECGAGLNMYFAKLSWNNPQCLPILVDQVIARRLIDRTVKLSAESRKRIDAEIKYSRRELGSHTAWSLTKFPARVPKPILRLIKKDAPAALMLPLDILAGAFSLLARKL